MFNLAKRSFPFALIALVLGCSSSSSAPAGAGGGTGATGGPIAGTADIHCKGKPATVVDPAACKPMGTGGGAAGAAGSGGSGGGESAGAAGASSVGGGANGDCNNVDPAYGNIAYGVESGDDDCKYTVQWAITPFAEGQSATLTVIATHVSDGSPVTAAAPRVEIFLPCELTHAPPAIDFDAKATETMPGTYTIGPVTFDKPGHWAVRFHFNEMCDDSPTSPHSHAAFYLGVP